MRITFTALTEIGSSDWPAVRQSLADDLLRLQTTINKTWDVAHHPDGSQRGLTDGLALGVIVGTLAEQPTNLTPEEDGLLYFVTDYGHLCRYDGPAGVWRFGPGDPGAGYFQDFAITPQANGWALCDGSATNYLVVGASALTTASITLPNLTTGTYRRGGAYTGSVLAATAPGMSGSLTTSSNGAHTHTVSGSTANEAAHTHAFTTPDASDNNNATFTVGGASVASLASHVHNNGTTNAGSAHAHGAGTLAGDSNGAHTHTIAQPTADSAGRPPTLVVAPYFRR